GAGEAGGAEHSEGVGGEVRRWAVRCCQRITGRILDFQHRAALDGILLVARTHIVTISIDFARPDRDLPSRNRLSQDSSISPIRSICYHATSAISARRSSSSSTAANKAGRELPARIS